MLTAVVPLVLLLSGCTATGTGRLPSNDPFQKATFGFSFQTTNGADASFSGSYHDPRGVLLDANGMSLPGFVDVAFKGTGVMHTCTGATDPTCRSAPAAKGGCIGGTPEYTSQNPAIPGSGTLTLLLCDLDGSGASVDAADSVDIVVDTGPYAGYRNTGNPSGNLTVRS